MNKKRYHALLTAASMSLSLLAGCQSKMPMQATQSNVPAGTVSPQPAMPTVVPTSPTPSAAAPTPAPMAMRLVKGQADLSGQAFADADVQVFQLGHTDPIGTGKTGANGEFSVSLTTDVEVGTPLQIVASKDGQTMTTVTQAEALPLATKAESAATKLDLYTTTAVAQMRGRLAAAGLASFNGNRQLIKLMADRIHAQLDHLVTQLRDQVTPEQMAGLKSLTLNLVGKDGKVTVPQAFTDQLNAVAPNLAAIFVDAARELAKIIADALDAGGVRPPDGSLLSIDFGKLIAEPVFGISSSGGGGGGGGSRFPNLGGNLDLPGLAVNAPFSLLTHANPSNQQIVYNPSKDEYLVVWSEDDDEDGRFLFYQRMSSEGTLIGSKTTLTDGVTDARVVYNSESQEYLVVWVTMGVSQDILAHRISSNGDLTGSEFQVAATTNIQNEPSVAWNSDLNEYMVVWHDTRNSGDDVYARRFSSTGAVYGEFQVAVGTTRAEAYPVLAFNQENNEYLAAWESDSTDIYAARLGSSGYVAGETMHVANAGDGGFFTPAIVYNSDSNGMVVAWPSESQIWGQLFTDEDDLDGSPFVVSQESDEPRNLKLVYNSGSQQFLFSWQDNNGEQTNIVGQHMLSDGRLIDDNFLISKDLDFDALAVSAAANPNTGLNALVYWVGGSNAIFAQFVH